MKKILLVAGTFDGGGVESVIMNIIRKIDRFRYRFDIAVVREGTGKFDEELVSLGVHIIKIKPIRRQGYRSFTRELRSIMEQNRYEIIHINGVFSGVASLHAAYQAGIPTRIYHSHNTSDLILNKLRFSLLKKLAVNFTKNRINAWSTVKLACGIDAAKYVYGEKEYTAGHVEVIHNAVDGSVFHRISEKEHQFFKEKFVGKQNVLLLGNAARFTTVKNQIFAIKLVEQYNLASNSKAVLCLAGMGDQYPVCLEYVKKHNLTEAVLFLGAVDDMGSFYKGIDVFLLPSFFEGLPVTAVEAQMCGVPMLISDSVTREADLGLSLTHFLSINSIDQWVDTLTVDPPRRVYIDSVTSDTYLKNESLYGVEHLIDRMREIYD